MERHPSSAEFNNDNVNNDQRRVESIYMMRQKIDLGWEGGGWWPMRDGSRQF